MAKSLPINATAWERALERVSAERYPLDTDIIRRAKNPWECPEELLPYLAFELSVDLWDNEWPTAKRRAVIARAVGLAKIKGTEAGISEAVEIVGAKVVSVFAPPSTMYLSVTRTPEEKAEWLSRMPQLRIYPQRNPAKVPGLVSSGLSAGYLHDSTAFFDAAPRVTLWRRGVETDLLTLERRLEDPTISEAEEFVQARDKGRVAGTYVGGPAAGYLADSTASDQVYTVRTHRTLEIPGAERLAADFARPSMEPIDVRPDTVWAPAPLVGQWSGQCQPGVGISEYLLNSNARTQVFQRVYLFDPDAPAMAHSGLTYLGYNTRFGPPAYTAELKVEINQPRPPAAYSPEVYGFLVAPDAPIAHKVVEAVLTHKSRRDRILINTTTHGVVTAGPGITAGSGVTAGQIVRA